MASTAGYLGCGFGFGLGFASSYPPAQISPTSSTSSSSDASTSTICSTMHTTAIMPARISKRKLAHPQKAPPSLGYADEEQERLALQPRYMDLSLSLHSASAGIVWSTTCPSPGRRVVHAKHVSRLVEETARETKRAKARLARSKRERSGAIGLGFGYDVSPAAGAKAKRHPAGTGGAMPFFGTSGAATLPDSPSSSLPRNTATPPVPAQTSAPPSRRSSVAPATLYARPMVRRSSSRGGAVALSRSNSTDSLASAASIAIYDQAATSTPPTTMALAVTRRGKAPAALRGTSPLPLAMSTFCASPSPTDSAFSSSAVDDALHAAARRSSSSSKRLLQAREAHHRLEQALSMPEPADSDVYEDEGDGDNDQDDGDYYAPRRPRATKKAKLALSDAAAAAVEAVPAAARPQRASRSARQSPDTTPPLPPPSSSLVGAPRPTVKITRPAPAPTSTATAAAPRPLTLTLSLSGAGPSQYAAVARASSRAPRLHSPLSQTFPAAPSETAQHKHRRAAGVV